MPVEQRLALAQRLIEAPIVPLSVCDDILNKFPFIKELADDKQREGVKLVNRANNLLSNVEDGALTILSAAFLNTQADMSIDKFLECYLENQQPIGKLLAGLTKLFLIEKKEFHEFYPKIKEADEAVYLAAMSHTAFNITAKLLTKGVADEKLSQAKDLIFYSAAMETLALGFKTNLFLFCLDLEEGQLLDTSLIYPVVKTEPGFNLENMLREASIKGGKTTEVQLLGEIYYFVYFPKGIN